ncbi:DNA-binding transcriptional regulator, LysR family [Goodfellowiella coeruleoviolacea]|uniref:DNA-binding transcriptional regulator, LysR family n=2 Tax=Goodfellowiella coeruleoviolacea TaxID=334858 RepID=A0AAE3KHB2_9PSEU|nr:DNA-binding transcriptional regulator, LysR family [Goodfellowiella coeruleoviolacea]
MNLLVALDALLAENSVTAAADRLHTSAPAMSRTLARIRRVLGDPVLVRAGRHLVPTPRALELRAEVRALVERAHAVLTPAGDLDPATVTRSFAVQANDGLVAVAGTRLIAAVRAEAPGVTLRFLSESLEGTSALRDGRVDLEIGVIGHVEQEARVEQLLTDRMVGVVRPEHPLARGRVTPRRLAAADHVVVSRRGRSHGPIDDRLAELGLQRRVVATMPSLSASLLMARDMDVVCLASASLGSATVKALGLRMFELPLDLPPLAIGMAWHPRNDADRVHRWLRDRVRQVLRP